MKIWGRIVDRNKIIKDKVVELNDQEDYQDSLKKCIYEICRDFDMERPYWLPSNVDEYNTRRKTIFTKDNFIDEFDFDKFVIEEIKEK
ncbi:hypothetical protein [Clostridium tyrobutyricum]|uniref:hypothetical protein n=1 Tax=Clostridium tyrobutyricum TaxID=1519 RepID=UPI001C386CB7|nr:hypothetical protein [Clostridium tyrobutyricum]MBV4425472.1 hypothetical protein [Clostridium tyrobutyricum]